MKKYYIYQTTNLVNGKIYIGVHGSENIDKDRYIGSGRTFLKAVIDRCKGRNACKVIQNTVTKDKNLTEADIGKTFKELGWSFESAESPQ